MLKIAAPQSWRSRGPGQAAQLAGMKRERVDHLGEAPLYLQLADILARQIAAGDLAKGELLPSETQLQEHEVARGTVRQAIAVLRDRRLVRTLAARGTVVIWSTPAWP